ncbi:hypothetical protein N9X32_04200 [Pseudomonadales bacterium]|nr:hypothetical protein [Pseudomonadales bacterium]
MHHLVLGLQFHVVLYRLIEWFAESGYTVAYAVLLLIFLPIEAFQL